MRTIHRRLLLTASLFGTFAFLGCESKEDNNLAQAQQCLNTATAATASSCLSFVEGLETPGAYKVRCSVRFLSEGFTAERYANAFDQIAKKDEGGGMMTTLSFMSFRGDGTKVGANSAASTTAEECALSDSKGMFQLSVMAKTATLVVGCAGLTSAIGNDGLSPDQLDDLKTNVGTCGNTSDDSALGETVELAQEAYCGVDSSYQGTDICLKLEAAIAANPSDYEAIGAAMRAQLLSTPN